MSDYAPITLRLPYISVRLVDGLGYSRIVGTDAPPPYRVPRVVNVEMTTADDLHVSVQRVLVVDFAPTGEYDADGRPIWRDTRTASQLVPIRYPSGEEHT